MKKGKETGSEYTSSNNLIYTLWGFQKKQETEREKENGEKSFMYKNNNRTGPKFRER